MEQWKFLINKLIVIKCIMIAEVFEVSDWPMYLRLSCPNFPFLQFEHFFFEDGFVEGYKEQATCSRAKTTVKIRGDERHSCEQIKRANGQCQTTLHKSGYKSSGHWPLLGNGLLQLQVDTWSIGWTFGYELCYWSNPLLGLHWVCHSFSL